MTAKRFMSRFPSLARRFARCIGGVAATELALIAPVLLALFLGCAETGLLVRTHFQAAQMASTTADVIARYKAVTSADIAAIFSVSSEIMGTKNFNDNGTVILTSVATDDYGKATVAWQCSGGQPGNTSRIGRVGKVASVPGALVMDKNDNLIIAEVFYRYTPLLGWNGSAVSLAYKTALFRPRLGDLTAAPGC